MNCASEGRLVIADGFHVANELYVLPEAVMLKLAKQSLLNIQQLGSLRGALREARLFQRKLEPSFHVFPHFLIPLHLCVFSLILLFREVSINCRDPRFIKTNQMTTQAFHFFRPVFDQYTFAFRRFTGCGFSLISTSKPASASLTGSCKKTWRTCA